MMWYEHRGAQYQHTHREWQPTNQKSRTPDAHHQPPHGRGRIGDPAH